jgi:hypothetical protein
MTRMAFRIFVLAFVTFTSALWQTAGANTDSPVPNLSHADTGWFPVGDDFLPPPAGAGPVVSDPAHPYYSNQSGRQPTWRVADLGNPILKPWVIARLKAANANSLSGHVPYSPRETCWPAGVPGFDVFSRLRPVYFLQRPNEVLIINEGDQQLRHVYLNVPHSKDPKPSWYGESVGHYDNGDLVIDTIGLNDKTYIDNYLTPHTTALHVVERFHPDNTGSSLALTITVDDPGAFNTTWTARQVYHRRPQPIMEEAVCAENNLDFFGQGFLPIPEAKTPDF